MKINSLRKSTQILRRTYHLFQKKKKHLSPEAKTRLQEVFTSLQSAIMAKDATIADLKAKELQNLAKLLLKKTPFEQARDSVFAVGFALVIAILVRLTWFELYEIPTGSMRPTLKEQDRLLVSKTDFGINYPLKPEHIYFNPALTKRSGIFVFTGENMDIRDVDTLYFYIFPGKKQYIKRLMGKPGDTLYFYGGLIYGIDENGQDISQELQLPELNRIDHVPYIHFEGKIKTGRKVDGVYSPIVLYQMNEAVAELSFTTSGKVAAALTPPFANVDDYGNLFGIKNYAMTRLVTKSEVKSPQGLEEGALYLEIKHHPSLKNAKVAFDEYGRLRPMLTPAISYIPLQENNLRTLMANIYTARFEVGNGVALRYGSNPSYARPFAPTLPNVPNGCYEFYYGKAYKIYPQGIEVQLPADHPLYQFSQERIQLLFNLGMEFDTRFAPDSTHPTLMPARFAYFRNGDLYVAGNVLFKKDDPTLIAFVEKESKTTTPFIDPGPPLTQDGQLDVAFIKKYGVKLPPKMYMALGDNYAMSADSRDFGFVPESNLRGGPDLIFWPPGPRWGMPNQPPYPFFNGPRTIIWILALLSCSGWYIVHRRRNKLPLNFK
jgi:signal peptidase I